MNLITKDNIWVTGNREFRYYRVFGIKLDWRLSFLENLRTNCYGNTLSIGVYTEEDLEEILGCLEKYPILRRYDILNDGNTHKRGVTDFMSSPSLMIDWIPKADELSFVFEELKMRGFKTLWRIGDLGRYLVV